MKPGNIIFDTSIGRLDSMQSILDGYVSDTDVLKDLVRHAITVSINAKCAQFYSSQPELLAKIGCDFDCHFEKLAKRLQIKGGAIASNDFTCCEFSTEAVIIPQILSLVTEMRDCLLSGINVMSVGDKNVLGEIAACLDETVYCLTQCLATNAS